MKELLINLLKPLYHILCDRKLAYESFRIKKGFICFNKHGLNKKKRDIPEIIVSLTSYPARINLVPGVVWSLLNQSFKPDRIVIWLGKDKFTQQRLPKIYKRIRKCGVEIEFRQDIKSHTKYYYVMKENPNSIIITVDDDRIYHKKLIETLVSSYKKEPYSVSAARVHLMTFNKSGILNPYNEWVYEYPKHVGLKSFHYFATGVGGVLYPPQVLKQEVFNLDVIMKICHNHDDLWLKVMEVLSDVKVIIAADAKKPLSHNIFNSQNSGQYIENVIQGGNDIQTKAVLEYYENYLGEDKRLSTILFRDE